MEGRTILVNQGEAIHNAVHSSSLRLVLLVCSFVCAACSGVPQLSETDRAKLDPPLLKLVLGETPPTDLVSGVRADGTREYAVIIRASNEADIRRLGVPINSVFSGVMTARVTRDELRKIIHLGSVRSVQAGATDRLH